MEFPRADEVPELDGDLEFQVIDWFVPESDKSKQRRDREAGYPRSDIPSLPAFYEIFMFGVTAEGHSVTVKVNDFVPYFFVKIPQTWKQANVDGLRDKMLNEEVMVTKANGERYPSKTIKKTLQDHLVDMKLVKRKDVWGFTNFADFKFMKISVKSLRLYNDLKRYFSDQAQEAKGFKLYESNIDPMLRFIHEREIQPCGWVRIPCGLFTQINVEENAAELQTIAEKKLKKLEEDGRIEWEQAVTPCHARTNYCVETKFKSVFGLNYNKIAPLLIASFDLECTSSHGDFPVANKNYRKLTIDLIALVRTNPAITALEIIDLVAAAFKPPSDSSAAPVANPINRLYVKNRNGLTRASIRALMQPIAERLLLMVKSTTKDRKKSAANAAIADHDADSSGDDSDNEAAAEASTDMEITQLLDKTLPALAGDPIIQIGTTVHIYGSDKIVYKHIASYKSCQDIEDAEVDAFKTEAETILAWKDVITRLDPDILIGYNIFGFDMKYLADRARELGIYDEFVYNFGRLHNRNSDIEERKLSSSALGDNVMYCFDFDGMVQVDLLKVMQRDHKLDSYKLDSVASKFIFWPATVMSVSSAAQVILKTNPDGVSAGNYVNINGEKVRVTETDNDAGTITLDANGAAVALADGQKVTWGLAKDDISPNEIFAKFGGNSTDRMVIAKYCIQDCALVNKLMHKLKVLENNIAMGNVCHVPMTYLFMRGQGIKIFSLVSRECRLKNCLIPVIKGARDTLSLTDEVGYEGAIVLPPQEGMYLDDPITVFDYESLYPSSMISRNISHDALVIDPAYREAAEAENNGVTFHDITFDEYEGKGDKKKIKGKKTCTFAQFPDDKKGIVPSILRMLLTQRKNTRKKIEYKTLLPQNISGLVTTTEPTTATYTVLDVDTQKTTTVLVADVTEIVDTFDDSEKSVLDARQLAYKVTANSLYGQTGSRTSPIYLLEVAACTTATGREMILTAKDFMEANYNAHVIYGDSVTGYTPVIIRHEGLVKISTIEDLAPVYGKTQWIKCIEPGKQDKESCEIQGVESWTDAGWTPLHRVIRHALAPSKKIIRINTHHGIVDVTDDHSLLTPSGLEISPNDLHIGDDILHHPYPLVEIYSEEMVKARDSLLLGLSDSSSGIKCADQISMATMGMLASTLGFNASFYEDADADEYTMKLAIIPQQHAIKKMYPIAYTGYVYDLTTENHHFQAGVGGIIVHNTDSIFCKFPNDGKKGKEALKLAIATGQVAAKAIKPLLPPPQSLAYEKTLWPFILFSKKRYVGNLYEDDANKKPKQKSMGIVLKRRDNAPIVKYIYGGIIDILMSGGTLQASVDFLKTSLSDLVEGRVPLSQLVISKTLKGNYKDPMKIAHKVLAERIGERDPGNKPMVNDRIPFIYIKLPAGSESKLQGDRIEHPDYIRDNPDTMSPDYQFYITNQLLKPISQLYALCVDCLEGYTFPPGYWQQIDAELEGTVMYADEKKRKTRVSNMKMKEVKEILFEPFITKSPASPSQRKKPRSRANASIETIAEANNGIYFILTIDAEQKKRGSIYACTATVTPSLPLTTQASPATPTDDMTVTCEVWRIEKVFNGKKVAAMRMAAMEAVMRIHESDDLRDKAILITSPDKTFTRTWKAAIALAVSSADTMASVKSSLDDGQLREQLELNSFQGLVHARSFLNYVIQ